MDFVDKCMFRLLSGHAQVTTPHCRLSPYDGYDRRFEKMGRFIFTVTVTVCYVTGSRPRPALLPTASTQLFM